MTGGKNNCFGNIMVDKDSNSIEGIGNREFGDEVHGYRGEGDRVLLGDDRDEGNFHMIG